MYMRFNPVEPQRMFIDHLHRCPDALGLLGMGIGKTGACLHVLNDLFLNVECVAALVIAPLRVANLTWVMEAQSWDQFKWMKIANLRTQAGQRAFLNGSAHLYLINYEAIPTLVRLVERRGVLPYDVVIFDECTRAKNPSSKRINLFRRKVPRVSRHWGLTGTFMPNSWLDIFAQVRLVDGGERLGTNYTQFKQNYFYGSEHQFTEWKPKSGATSAIEKKISDITITLKSSDWLDIPDTVYEDVELKFTPELQEQYERLEEKLVIEFKHLTGSKTMNVASAATLVTKLLQFTSGVMYDDERITHPLHNLKLDALKKIVAHEKKPILVACIFQHEQTRIRQQFPKAKFFKDATTPELQLQMLNDWNAGKIHMLVAHPASVGHGLNLQQGSSVMVWISLTYSRELYEQMIARLARRGQENIIRIYRLMVPGTVDDAVAEALASKAQNEARLISALQMLESYRQSK